MEGHGEDRVGEVQQVLSTYLPGYHVSSVALLGEGCDNISYEVNGELILRFSKESDPARRAAHVEHEARLLTVVADISPLPVPVPRFVAPQQGCLAYRKLPGVPLPDLPRPQQLAHGPSIAAALGDLLAALHAAPLDRMAGLVDPVNPPLGEWHREAAGTYLAVAAMLPAARRRAIETFLQAPPPPDAYAPVFSHNDLGIEHVLVDPSTWTVTGVIDWSDAAIVDPAYDFGLIYRDLGPAALDAALGSYPAGRDEVGKLRERAVFYARCTVFEDLAYGVETGQDRYVDQSLTALTWLFPA